MANDARTGTESGRMMGCAPRQLLWKVQLPAALAKLAVGDGRAVGLRVRELERAEARVAREHHDQLARAVQALAEDVATANAKAGVEIMPAAAKRKKAGAVPAGGNSGGRR